MRSSRRRRFRELREVAGAGAFLTGRILGPLKYGSGGGGSGSSICRSFRCLMGLAGNCPGDSPAEVQDLRWILAGNQVRRKNLGELTLVSRPRHSFEKRRERILERERVRERERDENGLDIDEFMKLRLENIKSIHARTWFHSPLIIWFLPFLQISILCSLIDKISNYL